MTSGGAGDQARPVRLGPLGAARIGLGTVLLVRTTALGTLMGLDFLPRPDPLLGWPEAGPHLGALLSLPPAAAAAAAVARTVAALLFTIGLRTRPAGLAAGLLGYLAAAGEPAAFNMTMHILFLGTIVLACTDAGAVLAVRPAPAAHVPSSFGLVRLWVASIYVWAGLAKLHGDWLSGRVLGLLVDEGFVRARIVRALLTTAAARAAAAPAIAAGELAIGALLLVRRTRAPALAIALGLHLAFELAVSPDVLGWAMAALLLGFVGDIGPWRSVFATRPARARPPGAPVALALAAIAAVAAAAPGCDADAGHAGTDPAGAGCTSLSVTADPGAAGEAYLCFGFPADRFAGGTLRSLSWRPPAGGAAVLHHAKLYAAPAPFAPGPAPCDGMPPDAVGLHVFSPGASDLTLPAGIALGLPAGTVSLVVEAHAFRVSAEGTVLPTEAILCPGPAAAAIAAEHLAALLPVRAPVPAIRPHATETSSADCPVAGDLHLWSVWPHMHRIGSEIAVALVRADGSALPLADVRPWVFAAQATYPLDVAARGGDRIRLACTWVNRGDSYVFPGPRSEDEMCNAGFIAWPAAAARCAPAASPGG